MKQIIEVLEEMYYQKGLGKVEMPSKIGIHTQPDVLIHAMPSVYSRLVGYDDTNNAELCFFSV